MRDAEKATPREFRGKADVDQIKAEAPEMGDSQLSFTCSMLQQFGFYGVAQEIQDARAVKNG